MSLKHVKKRIWERCATNAARESWFELAKALERGIPGELQGLIGSGEVRIFDVNGQLLLVNGRLRTFNIAASQPKPGQSMVARFHVERIAIRSHVDTYETPYEKEMRLEFEKRQKALVVRKKVEIANTISARSILRLLQAMDVFGPVKTEALMSQSGCNLDFLQMMQKIDMITLTDDGFVWENLDPNVETD